MDIFVYGPIFTHENIKGSMGKWYPYSTWWEQKIVEILHIYGGRAISLLFCDHQDTQSESCEIEMNISQPIFAHKKISKTIWYKDIHTLQDWRKYCGNSSYLWSFSHCSTILWSPRHWIWVMRNGDWCIWTNINTEENTKVYMGKWYPYYKRWVQNYGNFSYLLR